MQVFSVLAAIFSILILIVIHELGHFLAARLQGIYATRFSIGFGPVIWKYQGPMTEYAVRAIPLGGYVGFPDEDPDSKIPMDDPNLLKNRPVIQRIVVISAGVIANFIFAWFAIITMIGFGGLPGGHQATPGGVLLAQIMPDSPAQKVDLKAGDVVLAVNGQPLSGDEKGLTAMAEVVKGSKDKAVTLRVEKAQSKEQLTLDVRPNEKGQIGVQLQPHGARIYRSVSNFSEAVSKTNQIYSGMFSQTLGGITGLFSGRTSVNDLSSPVGIVDKGSQLIQDDWRSFFWLTAIISISLGVINILPLPALDGGHLVFLLFEAVRGKPASEAFQMKVMQTGLLLLVGLGLVLIFKDTFSLVAGALQSNS
jgi:membrane-associated protease RseP (regulator of RpoE activity)